VAPIARDKVDLMANEKNQLLEWVKRLPEDVALLGDFLAAPGAPVEARVFAGGALNYLVTRMDLIPDWDERCGMLDDAMVLRTSLELATEHDLGDLSGELVAGLGRLANEAEAVAELLGAPLYQKFRDYVATLATKEVRGRSPMHLARNDKARREFYAEVADELKGLQPLRETDPAKVAHIVRDYFTEKLK
jgi:uncharacterized membrane protein YkvA (DUF1232 family)